MNSTYYYQKKRYETYSKDLDDKEIKKQGKLNGRGNFYLEL